MQEQQGLVHHSVAQDCLVYTVSLVRIAEQHDCLGPILQPQGVFINLSITSCSVRSSLLISWLTGVAWLESDVSKDDWLGGSTSKLSDTGVELNIFSLCRTGVTGGSKVNLTHSAIETTILKRAHTHDYLGTKFNLFGI